MSYQELGRAIGELVEDKQRQYGDSASKTGLLLRDLYPNGIQPYQYEDLLLVVRILDKVCRISSRGPDGNDRGGESPYRDLAGYGLIGTRKDDR